jgi:regulator of sirC expression with transglutaminase-like and TPR domain
VLPFSIAASQSCPPHAELATALAAEFRPVDVAAVDAALDGLAIELAGACLQPPADQLHAVAAAMAAFEALDAPLDPPALLIDVVLERLAGHPTTLAVIAAEAGRRAGLDVAVAGDGLGHVVVHRGADTVLDPASGRVCAARDDRLSLRCAHQVAFALLREHIDRALRVGDLAGALRAAELRLELPMEGWAMDRLERELRTLRARLN